MATDRVTKRYSDIDEWEALLNGNFDELLRFMVSSDERATRLRQSSPFTGPALYLIRVQKGRKNYA
jgi:hypothetical protein